MGFTKERNKRVDANCEERFLLNTMTRSDEERGSLEVGGDFEERRDQREGTLLVDIQIRHETG